MISGRRDIFFFFLDTNFLALLRAFRLKCVQSRLPVVKFNNG
jgi:hypothetical protein